MKIEGKIKYINLEGISEYYISEYGEVYSFKDKSSVKKLSQFIDNVGYKQVILYNDDGKRTYFRVHRLVGMFFLFETFEKGKVLNHKDGNKLNNNYKNLEWVTASENTKHAYKMNLYKSRKCKVRAVHKISGVTLDFDSIRKCGETLSLNRKTITSILKGEKKNNNYEYEFYYID